MARKLSDAERYRLQFDDLMDRLESSRNEQEARTRAREFARIGLTPKAGELIKNVFLQMYMKEGKQEVRARELAEEGAERSAEQ